MQNVFAVARREFVSYFNSPIAYLVVAAYLILSGELFFRELFLGGQADMRGFFGMAPLLFCFFTPLITMRLLAEERAQGTLELLLTMPVTDWQVVIGKFFASTGLIAVLLLLSLAFPLSVGALGPIDKGATVAAYVGMLLMSGTYAAIGLMTSAFTRNQIVAGILAMFIGFVLFIVGAEVQVMPPWLAPICNAISIQTHFMNIARGVIDSRDVLYYVSVILGCLVVAQTTLESRRWR
ncbi:MAG TPA: ABC transporter permease [Polyangia bacterium]|nr:ABC transporter permease [Polyangia bacterium]